jgi:hypothetical protein
MLNRFLLTKRKHMGKSTKQAKENICSGVSLRNRLKFYMNLAKRLSKLITGHGKKKKRVH